MQSAAGGTIQRLKPAFAMVCSRSKIPDPLPGAVPALLIVVIQPSLQLPFCRACLRFLVAFKPRERPSLPLCSAQFSGVLAQRGTLTAKIGTEARLNVDRQKVEFVRVQGHFAAREVRLIVSVRC